MSADILKYFTSALQGTPDAVENYRRVISCRPDIISGVSELQKRCPTDSDKADEAPIFLFSAGWRSGSTLLQRLLMSDRDVFLWGESYDHCGIVQALADTAKAFTPEWPPERYFYDGLDQQELSGQWIADLYPSLDNMRDGHRAFFETLFAKPARAAGAARWGLKEVRLGAEHAHYLKWLFPQARFIFLYRNPYDAYRSYCGQGRSWYKSWPNEPVFTAAQFGKHWRTMVEGYQDGAKRVDAMVIPYEALLNGDQLLNNLEDYLEIKINRGVLRNKVGSSEKKGQQIWVSRLQKWLLKRAVDPVASELGYHR